MLKASASTIEQCEVPSGKIERIKSSAKLSGQKFLGQVVFTFGIGLFSVSIGILVLRGNLGEVMYMCLAGGGFVLYWTAQRREQLFRGDFDHSTQDNKEKVTSTASRVDRAIFSGGLTLLGVSIFGALLTAKFIAATVIAAICAYHVKNRPQ